PLPAHGITAKCSLACTRSRTRKSTLAWRGSSGRLSARLTPPTAPYGSAIILHLVGGCLSLRLRMSSLRSRVNCSLVSVWACGRVGEDGSGYACGVGED